MGMMFVFDDRKEGARACANTLLGFTDLLSETLEDELYMLMGRLADDADCQ